MNPMTLHNLALLVGALGAAGALALLFAPQLVRRGLEAFPRSTPAAWSLTAIDLLWVAWIVHHASLGRFDVYKPALFLLAPLCFYLLIQYLDDLLAPRALGGLLLLVANPALKIIQWHPADARLVMTTLVYVWIVAGMALVLSPHLFRRTAQWAFATPLRTRLLANLKLALALGLIALALAVY